MTWKPILGAWQGEGAGDQQRCSPQARAALCRSGTWALEREYLGANRGSTTSYCVNWGSYFTFCAVRDPSIKQGQ